MDSEMPWGELRPLLSQHGILQGDVDGPIIFDEDLIEMVRRRLAALSSPPVTPDAAERTMRSMLPPPPPAL
jgi:hypothetical protein